MKISLVIFGKIILFLILTALILTSVSCDTSKKKSGILMIALVQYNDSPLSELSRKGIEEGLTLAGLTAHKDYELKVYNGQGDIGTLNLIFDVVVNDNPRLIFVTSTPTLQMAIKKIKDIPVVFTVVADPVIAGAGVDFENHLPNFTGISTMGDYKGMTGLIRMILPQTKKIGTLYSPGETNSVRNLEELKKCAEHEGIEVISVPVNSSSETTDAAQSLIARQPEIICQIIDNLTSVSISAIIKSSQENKIPMFGFVSDQAEKGAVLVVSRDYIQAGVDAARLAKKIIDGASPMDIPFELVSKTTVLINRSAAIRYGISIPTELLSKDNVIDVQ
jgi:ABC-type uncharacterized transport system substrate-binding protein